MGWFNHQLVIAQESGDALIPPMSGELEGDMQMICSETQQMEEREGDDDSFACFFCFVVVFVSMSFLIWEG